MIEWTPQVVSMAITMLVVGLVSGWFWTYFLLEHRYLEKRNKDQRELWTAERNLDHYKQTADLERKRSYDQGWRDGYAKHGWETIQENNKDNIGDGSSFDDDNPKPKTQHWTQY